MTTPTPRETALDVLLHQKFVTKFGPPPDSCKLYKTVRDLSAAIAWLEGLQAESDERAVRAFVAGVRFIQEDEGDTMLAWEVEKAEAEARRLLAEGALGT